MAPKVTPLPNRSFGAVIENVSLANLSEDDWRVIYNAFIEHMLLIFPGQHITPEEQSSFGKRFGRIEVLAKGMEAVPITNKKADGTLLGEEEHSRKILDGNEGWHSDSTYMPISAKASILSAHVVPSKGGETEFADMRSAYDLLDPALRSKIETLTAYHSLTYSQAKIGHQVASGTSYGFYDGPAPLRPLVKVHPVTGRKSLFIGRHAYGVSGLSEIEGEKLLQSLQDFACQAPRYYRHAWKAGDVVMWDNRSTLHRACPYDHGEERTMWHVRVSGEPATEMALNRADMERVAASL